MGSIAIVVGVAIVVYLWAYVHGLREGTRYAIYRDGGSHEEINPGKISALLRGVFCRSYYTPQESLRRMRKLHEAAQAVT